VVVDDPGVPKPGKASVGVARQYSGTLGQGGHCQSAVTCCDSARQATWPVAVRLYLPKTWADAPERWRQAHVPEEVSFQTKPAMAWALLDQARAWGVPHRGLVADADDGDHPNVLAGLEARQEASVVAVRTACAVRLQRAGPSRGWRADALLQTVPRWQWRTVRWRRGTKGWWRQQVVAVRGWRVTSEGPRHAGGLLGERATRGQPEERTYVWSHLSAESTREDLASMAHRRHAIEPCHEEAKGERGWDQYQGRLGPGFHRHPVTVLLAYRFLVWLERRPRRRAKRPGPPGDLVPPSVQAPAPDPAGNAS
jgi:SRSO17 transposase